MPSPPAHRLLAARYLPDPGGHVAECSCGWRSAPLPSAGMAGARWDRHRDEAAAEPETGTEGAEAPG